MANNKYAGYTPTSSKEKFEMGNRLDRVNPYEFRKGMDYELTNMGCSRLAESTIEEREKATETVIKNLEEHGAYYSALIQFEGGMNHGSKITEGSFKKFLETYSYNERGDGMTEVNKEIKDDKMVEPKYDKKEYTVQLKEAIKKEIENILEVSGKEADKINKEDDKRKKKSDKDSITTAKGKAKKEKALNKEVDKLEKERAKNKEKINPTLQKYKDGKMSADEYRKATKELVDRNKEIVARVKEIEKEKEEINLAEKMGRRDVAKTMMEKDTHMEILNIIKEAGVSLREGAGGIKMYYEIAKTAYQEGFMAGLHRN
jgi:hypothetical protein